MEATAIRAGPTRNLSPIATIVILDPHAMILEFDAINKPVQISFKIWKASFNPTLEMNVTLKKSIKWNN
jgi:hypothetical protein